MVITIGQIIGACSDHAPPRRQCPHWQCAFIRQRRTGIRLMANNTLASMCKGLMMKLSSLRPSSWSCFWTLISEIEREFLALNLVRFVRHRSKRTLPSFPLSRGTVLCDLSGLVDALVCQKSADNLDNLNKVWRSNSPARKEFILRSFSIIIVID